MLKKSLSSANSYNAKAPQHYAVALFLSSGLCLWVPHDGNNIGDLAAKCLADLIYDFHGHILILTELRQGGGADANIFSELCFGHTPLDEK